MPRRNATARRRPNERAIRKALRLKLTRDAVIAEAHYVCYYCGRKCNRRADEHAALYPTIDHKTPLSRGGNWNRLNLVCACRECNDAKGDKTAGEFRLEDVG